METTKKKIVIKGYEAGLLYREICEAANISRSTLEGWICKLRRSGEISKKRNKPRKADAKYKVYVNVLWNKERYKLVEPEWDHQAVNAVPLLDVSPMQCHFPCAGGVYCGDTATKRHGYCATHHKVVYTGVGGRL